jgi:Icc-related predicted phosphoesterase
MKILITIFLVVLGFSLVEYMPVRSSGEYENIVYLDYAAEKDISESARPIAVLGDLQRTSLWEVMMGREQNDSERELLISEINKENPGLLLLLGDMVYEGGNREQWNYFDNLLEPLKDIPVLPVAGNHEYYGKSKLKNLKSRFPQFTNNSWYSRVYGNLGLIFLDSNEDELSAEEWNDQRTWYSETLSLFNENPYIKGIVVFTHHPPFTNSLVTGDEKHIQRTFVKPFIESEKAVAFFSGHAHTYERFMKDDKSFIVSGGGGGPRVMLKKGKDCHTDEYKNKGVRPFHYILLSSDEKSLQVTVKGINKGETDFFLVDSFEIPLSKDALDFEVVQSSAFNQ